MRLFAAIELDDDTREAIAGMQQRLAEQLGSQPSLKWVTPRNMHLTLAFLGEVPDGKVPPIAAALSVDFGMPRFAVTFQSVGVFPDRGAPRVLWLGVTEGGDNVRDLQRQVTDRLARHGVPLERRAFHPHLTLARWRAAATADRGRVPGADIGAAGASLDVRGVTLFQSRLSSAGPTYTALARATLK